MIDDKDIPKAKGIETPTGEEMLEKIKQRIKQTQIKEVRIMGNLDAKETAEAVYAVGKVVSSIKKAKEDDGKLTAGDAMHFVDDVLPTINGVIGSNKIPAEFKDGYSQEDKEQIRTAWNEGSDLYENDEAAVNKVLDIIYDFNELLVIVGVIKPEAPTP